MDRETDIPPQNSSTRAPCVAQPSMPADRLTALLAAIEIETEPVVTLTNLLHLCRDEHLILHERVGDPECPDRMDEIVARLGDQLSANIAASTLDVAMRTPLTAAFSSTITFHRSPSRMFSPISWTSTTHTPSIASSVIATCHPRTRQRTRTLGATP